MNTQLIAAAIRKGARAKTNYSMYKIGIIAGIALAAVLLIVVIILLIKMNKGKSSDKKVSGMPPPPPMPPMPQAPQVPAPQAEPYIPPYVPQPIPQPAPQAPVAPVSAPEGLDGTMMIDTETPPTPVPMAAPVETVAPVIPKVISHYIVLTNIDDFSKSYEAKIDTKITVGKKNCDIVIPDDASISGTHCIIGFADNQYILSDDDSTNGTKYNDVKVTSPVFIENGGIITMGRGKFRVTMIDKEEEA